MSETNSNCSNTDENNFPTNSEDCSFLVGRNDDELQTFVVKKSVLVLQSEVFERMFNGDFKESASSQNIRLTDVEPAEFKKFLDYMSNPDTLEFGQFSLETLKNLIYLGNKYMVEPLKDCCIETIGGRLPSLNNFQIISMFQYARQIDAEHLISEMEKKCIINNQRFTGSIHNRVTQAPNLIYTSCIYDWELPIFYEFLKVVKSYVSNSSRFNMIEIYAKVQGLEMGPRQSFGDNQETEMDSNENFSLETLLEQINYSQMTAKEFYSGPAQSNLIKLGITEKYQILAKISQCEYK